MLKKEEKWLLVGMKKKLLIKLWGDDAIQAMLEVSQRNKDIFVRISQGMNEDGYNKNGEQCSSKIKKLRLEY